MKIFVPLLLLLVVGSCELAKSANILCLVGTSRHNNPSWLRPLFSALAERNHSLTLLSTDPGKDDGVPEKNIVRIHLENEYDVVKKHFMVKETRYYHEHWSVKQLLVWYEALLGTCRGLIETEAMSHMKKKLDDILKKEYDLIIYDATFSMDCLLGLLPINQVAPIMGVSSGKLTTDLMAMVRAEDTINPARVPHYLTELPKKMNYWQRVLNHVMYLGESFVRWSVVVPVLNNVLQDPYENPSVQLMLLNTHPVLDYIQNLPPNVIEVGGLHISSKTEAMPEYIEEFMEQFLDGIIYINLPYIDLMNGLGPNAVIQMINSYPDCGFIWNAHGLAELPEKIPNLLMCDNINQHDILAQPQIKAFLNHGDSFSLQDAIYYAVPLIVLPLILEEFNNAQRIKERELGVVLTPSEFTLDSFVKPLKSVLNDATYTDALYQAQIKFRNRQQRPVELAIWHAEQLISEPQMYKYLAQPDTVGQNYFVIHSLDILILPLFVLFTFVLNLVYLIYQIYEGYKLEKVPKKLSEKQKKLIKDKKNSKTNVPKKEEAGETTIGTAESKDSPKPKDE